MTATKQQLSTERACLHKIRQGDTSGWGDLYTHFAPLLYRRILMPRLANPTAAEDALAETFRTAMERFEQFEDTGAGISPWLARIAHNKAMDMHRARAVTGRKIHDLARHLVPMNNTVVGADDLLELYSESQDLTLKLHRCLQSLNPRYKQVLELRFIQEKDRTTCASELGVKMGTFDVLVLRSIRALQKIWSDESPAAQASVGVSNE